MPQLRQQIATAEAQVKAQQAESQDLTRKLADTQAQVQAKESALADAQRQLADIQRGSRLRKPSWMMSNSLPNVWRPKPRLLYRKKI